jgi:pimeloyl-ACP methyl ester carboxylesterase
VLASALNERRIEVAGVKSVVREGGADDPEAVVFVHGNPGSSRDWLPLASQVAEFARVVVPDMPGFGRADKPAGFEYTVPGYARHLAGLLDELGIRRAHLVLHDFGGAWGLAWAAAHPDAFASVVLIDTGILPGYRWHYLARIWRTPVLGELFQLTATRSGFHQLLRRGNPRGLPREFVDGMYDDYDRGTRRAVLRLYRATSDLSALGERLGPVLRPLNRPALVIWGRHDAYLSADYAERQRELFPGARVVVLEESGHWPYADDPAGVRAVLLPFLRSQVARAGH